MMFLAISPTLVLSFIVLFKVAEARTALRLTPAARQPNTSLTQVVEAVDRYGDDSVNDPKLFPSPG